MILEFVYLRCGIPGKRLAKMAINRIKTSLIVFITILITSSVWFLATVDGTVDVITNSINRSIYKDRLSERKDILELEVKIIELEMTKKYRLMQNKCFDNNLKSREF